MRLSKLVPVMFLCIVIWGNLIRNSEELFRLSRKKEKVSDELRMVSFISESFSKTCSGNGFESLNQWQMVCREMFNLDYIGWGKAESFSEINENAESILYYGKWISFSGEGEVYSRSKKEW